MPFGEPKPVDEKRKYLLWGPSGTGKTTLALQFPKVAVLDLENGTACYSDSHSFKVQYISSLAELYSEILSQLKKCEYDTIVLDSITVYWQMLQRKWSDIFLRRNQKSPGNKHEYYDFQPKDWMSIKSEFKEFVRKLISIDANIVVTAHEKPKYVEGAMMVKSGVTFDAEKGLSYMFDTELRLFVDGKGEHKAEVIKDKSGRITDRVVPNKFEILFDNATSGG